MAKAPNFDTSKNSPNDPGLTYVTPKAMPAKFNNLTGALDSADEALQAVTKYDEMNVIQSAEERAQELSDAYSSQSPSEINYWNNAKMTAEQGLANDPENPKWQELLNDSTTFLINAKAQGKISSYEFQKRTQIEANKLIANNPAYANEIVKGMADVYAQTGITDTIKIDSDMLIDNQASEDASRKGMITFLEKHDPAGAPELMDFESISDRYRIVTKRFSGIKQLEDNNKNLNLTEKSTQLALRNQINNTAGGIHTWANTSYQDLQNRVEDLKLENISNDEKRFKLNTIIANKISLLGASVESIGREEYSSFYTTQLDLIKTLKVNSLKAISGEITATDFTNKLTAVKQYNLLNLYGKGLNPEQLGYDLKLAQIYDIIKKEAPGMMKSESAIQDMFKRLGETMSRGVFKKGEKSYNLNLNVRTDPDTPGLGSLWGTTYLNQLPKIAMIGQEAITDPTGGQELSPMASTTILNMFNVTEKLGEGPARTNVADSLIMKINSMNQMQPELGTHLLTTYPEYLEAYTREGDLYENAIKATFQENSDEDSQIVFNEGLNIYATRNPKFIGTVKRINNLIKYRAIELGQDSNNKEWVQEYVNKRNLLNSKTSIAKPIEADLDLNRATEDEIKQAKEWIKNNPDGAESDEMREALGL
tara:strand:+ start:7947 stop:9899 length:1953 start_codon:yes stop_codon:yes gene_type:complete